MENAATRVEEACIYYSHTRPDKSKFDTAITVKRYSSAENLEMCIRDRVKGAVVCHSLEEALKALKDYDEDDIYIIGGESIYRQFLPYCTTAHVTSIDYTYDGDAYFPDLEEEEGWYLAEEGDEQTYFDLCYTFRRFRRKK